MLNLLYALGIGIIVFAALYFPGLLRLGEAIVPGVLASLVAYFVLARRAFKKVEKIFTAAASNLQRMPPQFELAVRGLEAARPLARYQFGVASQIDSQIGVIYFLQREFNKALPYLQKSLPFAHWMSGAMLGVVQYKKKDHEGMKKTFATVLKKGKSQGIVWNLYAYLLCQIGEKDEAQKVLIQGLKKTKDDTRVKDSLLALQNGKKIKMRVYKEQWYQFHLERPPASYHQQPVGGRMHKGARRGRW